MKRTRFAFCVLVLTVVALIAAPVTAGAKAGIGAKSFRVSPQRVRAIQSPAAASRATPQAAWSSAGTVIQGVTDTNGGAFTAGKLFIFGGQPTSTTVTDKVQAYTPGTNSWAEVTTDPIPTSPPGFGPQSHFAVCTNTDGTVHVLQGVGPDPTQPGLFLFAAHYIYNPTLPAGTRWSGAAFPMLANGDIFFSQDSGCSFIGGKLYLYAGYGVVCNPTIVNDCETAFVGAQKITWAYDPATDTWTDTGKLLKAARVWFGYTTASGNGIVAGGTTNLAQSIATAERFTPAAGWASLGNLTQDRLGLGLGVVAPYLVAVAGAQCGVLQCTLQPTTLICQSPCTSWSNANANIITQRWFIGYGAGGGKMYIATGETAGNVLLTSAEKAP